jgi:hypothetical protein
MKKPIFFALMLVCFTASRAAISVGPTGSGVISFGTQPTVAEGWSTMTNGGASGDISTVAALVAQVNTNVATAMLAPLGSSPTIAPSISPANIPRWNSSNSNLQSVATGPAYLSLLATLQNDTGVNQNSLNISFDLDELHATGTTVAEEVPGLLVFVSLTGIAGSWTGVPALSGGIPGRISATVNLGGNWAPGARLYILWADDNAQADRNNANTEEGGYTIDDVSFVPGGVFIPLSVALTAPPNGTYLLSPATINTTANTGGTIPATAVSFFLNGAQFATDTTTPYNGTVTGLLAGTYTVYAMATNASETAFSATNTVIVRDEFVEYAGGNHFESFDSMGPNGTETPIGWYVGPALPANRVVVSVGDGSAGASTASGWNYGFAGDVDRALGTAPTGAERNMVVRIRNNTPDNMVSFTINYDGEVWRNYTNDVDGWLTNSVSYDLGANWIPTGFDFGQPSPRVEPQGAVNGNDAVNRIAGIGGMVTPPVPIPPGGVLYIRWHDFNGVGVTDGGLAVDNFTFTGSFDVFQPFVTITSPSNGTTFVQGVPITIDATAVMTRPITSVAFFQNGNPIGDDTNAPYSIVYSNAALGNHVLTAIAFDDAGSSVNTTSAVVIVVNPNTPPTVTFTMPVAGQEFLVGDNVTNQVTVTDSDGTVSLVEFYVGGVLRYADTNAPFRFELCDALAGVHTISAVAVDNVGGRGSNSISITVTNPPDVAILVPNGSSWRYLDDGTDQGTAWRDAAFNDSGWNSGMAELGYGDGAQDRPERTVVGFGPNPNAKFATTYFRGVFNVSDPTAYSNLILRVLRDDHVIVYLNGNQVFSDMTNTTVNFSTYEPPFAADDGTVYQNTNVPPTLLVPGANILAVEIHQDTPTSSDISFDLMLWGEGGGTGGPDLTIRLLGNNVVLDWSPANWQLQATTELPATGDPVWSDVPGASPYVLPAVQGKRFFRTLAPDGTGCSSNVVGYVSLSVLPGNNLIANPFNRSNNHLDTILPLANDGTQDGVTVFRWKVPTQAFGQPIEWIGGVGWVSNDPGEDFILSPGEGFAFQNTLPTAFSVTFIGDAVQGNVTNQIPPSRSLLANKVPQAVPVESLLCFALDGDLVSILNPATQNFVNYQYDGFGWQPNEPTIPVGSSFFFQNAGAPRSCVRTFNVDCGGGVPPPQITQHPRSQTVFIGSSVTFDVVASGTPPLGYQWFFNGAPVSGATGPSHTIPSAQLTDAGGYSVKVDSAGGSVTSTTAMLKVYGPVVINEWMPINTGSVIDPADGKPDDWFELFNAGSSPVNLNGFRLTDNLGNTNKFTIQGNVFIPVGGYLLFWADNEPAQGPNHVNFFLPDAGGTIGLFAPNGLLMDSIVYTQSSPNVSQGRSPNGSLNIVPLPQPTPQGGNPTFPIISQQPSNQVVNFGGTATFSVNVANQPPLTYQWHLNCGDLVGETNSTLVVSNVGLDDIGHYIVTIQNGLGQTTSDDALLRLSNPAPTPLRGSLSGSNFVLQWPRRNPDYTVQEVSALGPHPVPWRDAQMEVTGDQSTRVGTVPRTEPQQFFRLASPTLQIIQGPQGGSMALGNGTTLSVTATGAPPLEYQWFLNGLPLGNATNSSLDVPLSDIGRFGAYQVVVQDANSAVKSQPGVLRPSGSETALSDSFGQRPLFESDLDSIHGVTYGATREPGEPQHGDGPGGKSVWLRWRSSKGGGIVSFDTRGSGFDTMLAAYAGTALGNLTRLDVDDDRASNACSRIQFNVLPNTDYNIAIDGWAGSSGFFVLNWNFISGPAVTTSLPVIDVQPQDRVVTSTNQPVTFSVTAHGLPPLTNLTYRWHFNGVPLPASANPNNSTLVLGDTPNSAPVLPGEYSVVIHNGFYGVESRIADLQISTDPSVKFLRKLAVDSICGSDEAGSCCGPVMEGGGARSAKGTKLFAGTGGSVTSSFTFQGSTLPGSVCTARANWAWIEDTFPCSRTISLTGQVASATGTLVATTLAVYDLSSGFRVGCANGLAGGRSRIGSFNAIGGTSYRIAVGYGASGVTATVSYGPTCP